MVRNDPHGAGRKNKPTSACCGSQPGQGAQPAGEVALGSTVCAAAEKAEEKVDSSKTATGHARSAAHGGNTPEAPREPVHRNQPRPLGGIRSCNSWRATPKTQDNGQAETSRNVAKRPKATKQTNKPRKKRKKDPQAKASNLSLIHI